MDYEQFLPKQPIQDKCDCSSHIIGTITICVMFMTLIECIACCKRGKRLIELESENSTLKTVFLTTIERTLIKMMKNGNDIEHVHED